MFFSLLLPKVGSPFIHYSNIFIPHYDFKTVRLLAKEKLNPGTYLLPTYNHLGMPSCQYCQKEYSYKKNLASHETICAVMRSSFRERNILLDRADETLPSHTELCHLFRTLSLRVDHLEKENRHLKHQQKRKLNMLSWLQQTRPRPQQTYPEWSRQLLFTVPAFLSVAFKENLYTAISQLINAIDTTTIPLPICAFEHKTTHFYIYPSQAEGWILCTTTEIENLIKKIADRFFIDFVEVWYKENQPKLMNNDKLYDEFIQNQQKVSSIPNYVKLRQALYLHIMQTVSSIIEYELV